MPIRLATEADAKAIAALGEHVVVGRDRHRFDFEQLPYTLTAHISQKNIPCFVYETSDGDLNAACMLFVAQGFWNPFEPVANVVLWWSRYPFAGLRVMQEAQKWAREAGAKRILSGARDRRAARLYERLGFAPIETNYLKEL
jgi:GNAT superfamily N-acetyltransferase